MHGHHVWDLVWGSGFHSLTTGLWVMSTALILLPCFHHIDPDHRRKCEAQLRPTIQQGGERIYFCHLAFDFVIALIENENVFDTKSTFTFGLSLSF